eukprot:GFUD01093199.1.p1 GENE.GFUD01093199.1~~GFUD01093199.1.p1  ORF type:complete len:449 (+),score=85.56 GFUD01093199.1:92-1348(+)
MQNLFEPLRKLCRQEKVAIDNGVFRLHYKGTVILLILFSAMLTAKQYFGDPIDCLVQGVPASIVNTYCWVHGTFTLRRFDHVKVRSPTAAENSYFDKMGHRGIVHPGIETSDPTKNQKIYHIFYQWVGFIIFLQAILFYLPRHLWKTLEEGRIKFCTKDMKEMVLDDDVRLKRVDRLNLDYSKFKGKNNHYAAKFFFCEIINLMNVIFQIFYINKFIGGKFLDYGSRILDYNKHIDTQTDPMDDVFPKMTKCQFNRHGPGGDINNHDALCLLPLNIVNEKIYLVMWLWLITLAVASALAVIYRATCVVVPGVRTYMLWGETSKWSHIADVCKDGHYGDWFLLRQISKNVDQETFDEFLTQLSKEVNPWDTNGSQSRISNLMRPPTWLGWFRSRNSDSGCCTERGSSKGFDTEPSTCEP